MCSVISPALLFSTPWTVACQAPLSMGFPRQEYWSELPFPSPGDFPVPGIEPESPALQVDYSLLLSHQGSPCLLNKKLLKSVLLIITSKGENTIQILELVLQWREKMLKLNHHRNVLEKLNFMWLFSVLKTKQSLRSLLPRNLNSWVFLLYRNTLKKYVNCSFSLRLVEGVTGRES